MAQGTGGIPGQGGQMGFQFPLFEGAQGFEYPQQPQPQRFEWVRPPGGVSELQMVPQQPTITPKNIFDVIKQGYSQQYSSVLPYLQAQLGQQGQFLQPQLQAIRAGGEQGAAIAQSEAGARGLRGSDIEAAGMTSARNTASQQAAQLQGQLALQQSNQMAEYIMKLWGMDVQSNQELFNNLAMLLGQELTAQRDQQNFRQQLAAQMRAARSANQGGTINALIGAAGNIVSALIPGMKKK